MCGYVKKRVCPEVSVVDLLLVWFLCVCSALSIDLHNLYIVQHILGIPRTHSNLQIGSHFIECAPLKLCTQNKNDPSSFDMNVFSQNYYMDIMMV